MARHISTYDMSHINMTRHTPPHVTPHTSTYGTLYTWTYDTCHASVHGTSHSSTLFMSHTSTYGVPHARLNIHHTPQHMTVFAGNTQNVEHDVGVSEPVFRELEKPFFLEKFLEHCVQKCRHVPVSVKQRYIRSCSRISDHRVQGLFREKFPNICVGRCLICQIIIRLSYWSLFQSVKQNLCCRPDFMCNIF